MRIPEAIIFDLDDTILDDESGVEPCWRTVCGEAARQLAGLDAEKLFLSIERERDWFWSDPDRHREGRLDLNWAGAAIIQRALMRLGFESPDLGPALAERYRDLRLASMRPFVGAIETLERLQSAGVRLGLITNGSGPIQRMKIERFGLAPYFEHILIEGEFGFGKPHLEVYETVLGALPCEATKAWSVGDNLEWDVSAPQTLGVYGIWVDVAGQGLPVGHQVRPDRIIRSVAELVPTDPVGTVDSGP